MDEQLFQVPEMHCGACEASIRQALSREPGVAEVSVDLERKQVLVRYAGDATTPASLRQRIERAGFDVSQ